MEPRRWFSLCLLVKTIIFLCCGCNTVRPIRFWLLPGLRITSGTTITRDVSLPRQMTLLRCARLCGADCGMFHYSKANYTCEVFAERYFDSGVLYVPDDDWITGLKNLSVIVKDDWTLAFRAQSGTGSTVFHAWIATGVHHDNNIQAEFPHACLRFDDYSSCDRHFRSHILDAWTGIKEV
ncbi:hypothetical protein ElyMa_001338700 [Elysia marginata]|uniref:Apple domain-containing protein n=1 Tax=Elysia marginata TaxID=1093978 RepID=A0AAV4ILW7_9GAST|nr:hypothetical protein ElyMa_001338700 [Elysia marginata]